MSRQKMFISNFWVYILRNLRLFIYKNTMFESSLERDFSLFTFIL
jgi:hypothetical protein